MKKIILLTIVLTVIAGSAVFANGAQEQDLENAVRPWGPYGEEPEMLSLKGTLSLEAGQRPGLVADGEEYELMYPPFLDDGISIENGQSISVEGFLVPGPRWDYNADEKHLMVTKAVINGKEYDLGDFGHRYGPMMGGNFGSRGGNYGPRGGMMGGYRGSAYPECPNCDDGYYNGRGSRGSFGGRRGGMMGGYNNSPRGRW